jgi:ClpP class serine protease
MVMQGLTKAAWYKPTGIIVTINSPGGVVSIAQHIADSIKHLAARNKYPSKCI